MTFGQLFTVMNPDVKVRENSTCVWLFFDEVNHYTIAAEWWKREIPDYAVELLNEPKPVVYTTSTVRCPGCGKQITTRRAIHPKINYCWKCGQAVKWGD